MKILATLLLTAILSTSLIADVQPKEVTEKDERIAKEVGRDLEKGGNRIKLRMHNTLDIMMRVAVSELLEKGYIPEAQQLENEWNEWSYTILANDDLGDHAPLSKWLATTYQKLEDMLGVWIMEQTHLIDLKVMNYSIPVVFNACTFDMGAITIPRAEEYACHFVAYGKNKDGAFAPVVTWWASYIGCTIGTMGTGFSFVCGAAAEGAKWIMKKHIAPPISKRISAKCSIR